MLTQNRFHGMGAKTKLVYLWLGLLMTGLVASCSISAKATTEIALTSNNPTNIPNLLSPTQTPNPTATYWAIQSQTAAPVATSIAKINLTFEAQATIKALTPTSTPSPTRTPPPTSLRTPTENPVVFTTPLSDIRLYRLKNWTDHDQAMAVTEALNLVLRHDDFDEDIDVIRRYLIAVAQEDLWRFPTSPHQADSRWALAYVQAIGFDFYPSVFPVSDFTAVIAAELNSGALSLDQLSQRLNEQRFVLSGPILAPNLFGDGRPIELFQVKTGSRLFTKMVDFVVVAQEGTYTLIPLRDHWLYIAPQFGADEWILINEFEGKPMIVSVLDITGSAACYTLISAYQWQGNEEIGQFVDITEASGILNNLPQQIERPGSLCNDGSTPEFRHGVYDFELNQWDYLPEIVQLHNAENLLFEERDVQSAINTLSPLLDAKVPDGYDYDFKIYICYLLALAYEAIGDEEQVLNLYWQLWNAYPTSPYTLIIQRKLEPVDR